LIGKEADGKVNYIQIYVGPMSICSRCYRWFEKYSREKGHSFSCISTM